MRLNTITICLVASVCTAESLEEYPLLQQPISFSSSEGKLDVKLTVGVGKVRGPYDVSYNSRLYNGAYPGPTIRCRAGDKVSVQLNNELQNNNATREGETVLNEMEHPNSTNLHLHGMHISGEGRQDNISVRVDPGTKFQYEYEINPEHTPGTSYYHPHLHGSGNLQVHGLMGGAFIVEDETETTSPELLAMEDLLMMVQSINLNDMEDFMMTNSNNGTSNMPVQLENPEQVSENLLIVNGQYKPRVELKIGQLIRLRVINGNSMTAIMFGLSDTEACDLYELAYDGVYLEAPRAADAVFISAGGRVDVAVRCSTKGLFSVTTVAEERLAGYAHIWGPNSFTEPENANNTQALVMLDVSDEIDAMDLPTSLPDLPKYLQRVRIRSNKKDVTWTTSFAIELSDAEGASVVNNQPFNPDTPLNTLKLNKYYQWSLSTGQGIEEGEGYAQHPYHQHINHFIIMSSDPVTDGLLFREGDIRDTIPLFKTTPVDVRFYTANYAGPLMLHCHDLMHADTGMMGFVEIEE